MGASYCWIFQFPHKISEGENIEKQTMKIFIKIKKKGLEIKLEILKIKKSH